MPYQLFLVKKNAQAMEKIMRLIYTILLFTLSFSFNTTRASEDFNLFEGYDTAVPVDSMIRLKTSDSCHFAMGSCFMQVKFRRRSDNSIPASLWEVDVSRPGDFCYFPNAKVVLWRPEVEEADLRIQHLASDEEAYSIPWEQGQDTMSWPFDTSPKAGTYLMGIHYPTNQVVFHQIPSEYSSIREIKDWMEQAEQGCLEQALMLNEEKYQQELLTLLKKPPKLVMNY
jgi:hypothetical protein